MTTPKTLGVVPTPNELCTLRRLSPRELRDAAGVSLNTVHRALAGQPVHRSTLRALLGAVSSPSLPATQEAAALAS